MKYYKQIPNNEFVICGMYLFIKHYKHANIYLQHIFKHVFLLSDVTLVKLNFQ